LLAWRFPSLRVGPWLGTAWLRVPRRLRLLLRSLRFWLSSQRAQLLIPAVHDVGPGPLARKEKPHSATKRLCYYRSARLRPSRRLGGVSAALATARRANIAL